MTDSVSIQGSPAEAGFMAVVLVVMFFALFVGCKTPEIVVFFSMVLVWNVGLLDTTDALSGFSNSGMLANGALFVVIKGVEKSQFADKAARRVFGLKTSQSAGLARMMGLCFTLSAFLNNTPVVALLIPITRDWARARGFSPSIFLIPLSYSVIFGGLLTLIGTSTNLVVQGLVLDEAKIDPNVAGFGFFEPAYIGLPLGIIGIVYLVIFAPRALGSGDDLFDFVRDRANELLTEVQVTKEFPYNGEPASVVLTRLGLPQDTLIKIRRKVNLGIVRGADANNLGLPRSFSASKKGVGAGIATNLKTFTTAELYSRQRVERLWGTKKGLDEEDNLSRSMPNVSMNGAAIAGHESFPREPAQHDIFPVPATEVIQAGDVLFLSCAQEAMIEFQAVMVSLGLKGLHFLDVSASSLLSNGTDFFEVVLSEHNHFVGRTAGRDNSAFSEYYDGCSVVAVRRRGQSNATNPAAISAALSVTRHAMSISRSMSRGASASFASSSRPPRVMDFPESIMEEGRSSSEGGASSETSLSPNSMGASLSHLSTSRPSRRQDGSFSTAAATPERTAIVSPVAKPSPSKPHVLHTGITSPRATPIEKEEDEDVTESPFKAGDVVLILAKADFMDRHRASSDFLLVTKVGSVPKPVRYLDYLPLFVFLGMLIWVLLGADMVQAAFLAGGIMVLGGWVDAKNAVGHVNWRLLLLIGSALGLSKGVVNSGLASYVGTAIRNSGMSADCSLFVICAFTMACTEAVTNNAAAALATPIAFGIARELEVSYKPFVMTVLLAASWSFITPIGYQTNTLVWGPGGYKFADFVKIGTPLSAMYLVTGCLLIPRVFPF